MKKILTLIFTILTLSLSANAQDVLDQRVTTDEFLPQKMDFCTAVNFALKNNNDIKAMRKNLSASEKNIGIARSEMMPKLKFNETFLVTNNPIEAFTVKLNQTRAVPGDLTFGMLDYPGATTNFLTSGIIEQKIFDRKSMIGIKIAKKEYSANGYMFLRKEEELVYQVTQAYLKVIENQELIEIHKLALNDVNAHLVIAEKRYKSKIGAYSDILRGRSAKQLREANLIAAQRDLDVSKMKLGLLLGLENPIEVFIDSFPDLEFKEFSYYKNISNFRNDIKATEVIVENSKNKVSAAQADWYPTLTSAASYNFYQYNFPFGGQGNNYIATAFFRWDIFDGNKRKYEILKAKDKEGEAKEYLLGLKKKVGFNVYESYLNVEEHKKNLALSIEAKSKAEEDNKLIEEQWKNSKVPLVALIDSQVNLNDTRLKVVQTKFDMMEDIITIYFESGILNQALGLKY